MPDSPDLEPLLSALRAGLITPDRLAREVSAWPAARRAELAALLAHEDTRSYVPQAAANPASLASGTGEPDVTADYVSTPEGVPNTVADTAPFPSAGVAPVGPLRSDRYLLLRIHRTGGLGQVWIARDRAVGRDVALKTLRPDRAADPATRARFVREARVTGRLEHPCVVPLYDLIDSPAGSQPFYAMRFVTGRTLAEAAEEYHKGRSAGLVAPLQLAALLDALVAVCRAVAFAHDRDVLHRDLKGQNIVLGDFGEVFLLDWGLAKEAGADDAPAPDIQSDEPVELTRPGATVGTPAFLAPEVAGGAPATVASDVYGLGTILYTILAGKSPYEGATASDVIGQVIAAPPPPPTATNPAAPPALVAICLRAMARQPEHRYSTADELATEVRRWLADEPVSAYPDPFLVRARRWARRHRTAVAAAAVFLVTTVAALATSTALIAREERRTAEQRDAAAREWKRAEGERREAETARAQAVANFRTARELAFNISGRINDLETGRTDPRASDTARLRLLDEAGKTFDQFREVMPDDDALIRQAANIHRYRANVARTLNQKEAAVHAYQASIDLWQGLADRRTEDADAADNLGQTLRDQAMFLKRIGKLREARAAIDRACELADGMKARLNERSYARSLGVAEIGRSEVAYLRGDFAGARKAAIRASELLQVLEKPAPGDHSHPADGLMIGLAFGDLAQALREEGQTAEALKEHDRATEKLRAALGGPLDRDARALLCEVRIDRALTLDRIDGRRAEAAAELAAVVRDATGLAEKYPDVAFYKESLAAARLHRGELLIRLDKPAEAGGELKEALGVTRALVDRFGSVPEVLRLRGWTYLRVGQLSAASGRAGDAKKEIGNAVTIFKLALKADPDNIHHRRGLEAAERAMPGQ